MTLTDLAPSRTTLLTADEAAFLVRAARFLEQPGFLVRVADLVGRPVDLGLRALPAGARSVVARATDAALRRGLAVAISSLPSGAPVPGTLSQVEAAGRGRRIRHDLAVAATGAAGGFFGWMGLAVELPVTTSLMLRSIAAAARDFGEDLRDPASRLECLAVLSHGSPRSAADDALDSAYFSARVALSHGVAEAAAFLGRSAARDLPLALARAPVVARLLASIASRFNVVVTEKVLAAGVPVLGAAGGAAVNAAFADHFNTVARHHFGIRRLERIHGPDVVRRAYEEAARRLP